MAKKRYNDTTNPKGDRNMPSPGENEMSIELRCRKCVPPERHPGCHDDCKWYLEWKKEWNEHKAKEKQVIWLQYLGLKDR